MKRRVRVVSAGLVAALVFVAAAAGVWYVASGRTPSGPSVGRPAPEFQLPLLEGASMSLADARGRPVLINFWATWCEPCKQEMPEIEAAARSHPELVVLGVDYEEPAARVKPFVEQLAITFPILLDMDGLVVDQYRLLGTPSSFFVDSKGVLRSKYIGAMSAETLQKQLATIGIA